MDQGPSVQVLCKHVVLTMSLYAILNRSVILSLPIRVGGIYN